MNKILPFASLLILSACGDADNDPGPGGVSVGEAKALDEAASMIEASRLPADNPEEGGETNPSRNMDLTKETTD